MHRFLFAAVVVLSLALAPGAALGQQANETTTATETPAPTPATEDVEEIAVEIDDQGRTVITDWSFSNGTWHLTIEAERPTLLTVTDSARAMEAWEEADSGQKGSVDLNPQTYTLSTGTTRISYPGTVYDGQSAISVATSDGLKMLFTGGIERDRPPVAWGQAQALIVLSGLGAAVVTFRRVRSKYDEQDEGAERIA